MCAVKVRNAKLRNYLKHFFDLNFDTTKGCLYGSEPARVPELARIPEMNFTTRLHETYMKGWLFVF
jgi:hypothetical protein